MKFREIKTSDKALTRIDDAVKSGALVGGEYVKQVERQMKEIAGTSDAVAMSSGTMALKIAMKCMGVGYGDFVIVPDITFVGCATAVMELGAIPVFVDVDPITFVLDERSTREEVVRFDGKVKAIMAVRLGGEPIPKWVYELGLPVLVDSAHSMEPVPVGAVAGCYSFYPTKIISGIEGGVMATNDRDMAARASELRLFGFVEGTRISQEAGYKGNMTNVSAAMISANLEELGANLAARERVRDRFNTEFGLTNKGLGMYMVLVENPEEVVGLLPAAIRHYPMTLSCMFSDVCVSEQARWVAKHILSLPFHEYLVDNEVTEVCAIVKPRLITYTDHYGSKRPGATE